jgi:hypothetical protein
MRKPKGFHAGRLDTKVRLLKRAAAPSGPGGFQEAEYEAEGPALWAEWNDAGARELGLWQSGTTEGAAWDARLVMRHYGGASCTWRLLRCRDGTIWEIAGVKEYYGAKNYMELAVRRAGEGGTPVGD